MITVTELIDQRHRERMVEVVENPQTPLARILELQEIQRQAWIAWYATESGDKPAAQKRVVAAIEVADVLAQNIGRTMTAPEIAEIAGVSQGSVYNYLVDNPTATSKVGRGTYLVRDVAFERAEAGRPTVTIRPTASTSSAGVSAPAAAVAPSRSVVDRAAEVEEALAAVTGHTPAPFTGRIPPK